MPSVTLKAETHAAAWSSPSYAAGAGPHAPVGTWGSTRYRSAFRFPIPAWAAWTKITKATLTVYISDHQHVGVRNSSIYCRRMSVSSVWTKSSGSQSCNNGFSGSNNTQYGDIGPVTTDQVTFSSGTTANAKKTLTVTPLVNSYFSAKTSKIVFVFDQASSSDYTELWTEDKSATYTPTLVIEYEEQSVPNAPSLTSPADGAVIASQRPSFAWTHSDAQNEAQASAEVEVSTAAGAVISTQTVTGSGQSLDWPTDLPRDASYKWRVRTADAGGYGAWSGQRSFTVAGTPVVAFPQNPSLVFAAGAPRLNVAWTITMASGATQTKYRVTSGTYDSGWLNGGTLSHVLSTLAISDGVSVPITVEVEDSYGLRGQGSLTGYAPRYGLTKHRKDLTTAPLGWGTPTVDADVPTGSSLVIEYGSNSDGSDNPVAWHSSLGAVTRRRYLLWRAWFLPSGSGAKPVLKSISIPVNNTATMLDDWSVFAPPWSVDQSEYVYGTRSVTVENNGTWLGLRSQPIPIKAGRSYILTGLMKSAGNSGCHIAVSDANGNWMLDPSGGAVKSQVINETRDWYAPDALDVYRYRSPVFVAPADMDVFVYLVGSGASGTQAWFDAVKLEESSVATPWSPASIGAAAIDAGGVQIDGSKGAVLRYRGSAGGARDIVEGGAKGLVFGSDTEIASPSTGVLTVNGVPIGGAPAAPVVRTYAPGSAQWDKPASGLLYITVEVQGGGGAGGGTPATDASSTAAGGGGGSGGYARKLIKAADLAATAAVVVGSGGAPAAGAAGGAGGPSSFSCGSITLTCTAGSGGAVGVPASSTAPAPIAPGAGGTATGGDININGIRGVHGAVRTALYFPFIHGAPSVLGLPGTSGASGGGAAASGYGSGGGGATANKTASAYSGGAGAPGIVIITEYYG